MVSGIFIFVGEGEMTFVEAYLRTHNWQRKVVLVSMFHKSRLSKDHRWTVKLTARYFKSSVGLISENLKLSVEWEKVKDCSSRNAALKVLKNDNNHK
jgi:hypothetical protein